MAAIVVVVLIAALLNPGTPAQAAYEPVDRGWTVSWLASGGPSVRRAAEAALLGSDDDVWAFVNSGRSNAQQADDRAAAQALASMDGPAMRAAALQALAGSPEAVRTFVNSGWKSAWAADERVRAYRLFESGGQTMRAAAQQALAGTPEELTQFLAGGRDAAQHADDRLAATRMLTNAPNNSGPVLNTAASQALAGSAAELREFLESGQFVARARDKELASISGLTEQAKAASETTSLEALAATEASNKAAAAAEEAKKAAQTAAAETAAAGGAAAKASAAAGRAADAAEGAADAARDAVSASNAAMRAARVAADAARKATTAASLTAQAASRAQRAAADARTDAGKASAARQAAQAARTAAAKARELDAVKAERDRALAQAKAAAVAASSASGNADIAAAAAGTASNQAGVSQAQAKRARDAAARAQGLAAAAARAADRAYGFALSAAKASDEAFAFAKRAADHADAAAAAAEAAAAAAGVAAVAAAESAKHAAAAVEAANTAVEAANAAVALERQAREEDDARLAEATDQGVLAAQAALAGEQAANADAGAVVAWNRKLLWDSAEEDRIDPATRQLLSEATASDAPTAVVLDRGRRAALALVTTGGEWTREAAREALSGGELELRSWLTEKRRFAVGQDDRARLWHLIDTLPDGNEKTAARTALTGDDATVQQFLRTRNYGGKFTADRQAIYRILETAGPSLKAAAERALTGTGADMHKFLREGQYPARSADERLEVYRVMDAGGPQVKAAGQVALAGPASYISYFLTTSRYQAAQRDNEQNAHVAAVQALITEAQQYAQTALADAAEARRVAAVAAGKAAEAQTYAEQAAAAAQKAASHAASAAQSATAAKSSADQAAQSAATARSAANSAQASADQAAQSAATATAASRRAAADSAAASEAARQARQSAVEAGKDAVEANKAAQEAANIYAGRLLAEESARRNTDPGSGPGGVGTAADQHMTWSCLLPALGSSKDCVYVKGDFAWALVNPVKCATPANSGTPGCQMLDDIHQFVEENPELVLDMIQMLLMSCGLAPGVGEPCDGVDAAISFARGDWSGGFISIGSMFPIAGWIGFGMKGERSADKLRKLVVVVEALAKCKKRNSFTAGTLVQLADGSRRPIEQLRVGETVLATSPVNGQTTGKVVTDVIRGVGMKQLVDIGVAASGARPANKITATDKHPFWVVGSQAWKDADDLVPGDLLRTPEGRQAQVKSISKREQWAQVYNLTVAEYHSYYVAAGKASVLVHNDGGGMDLSNATPWENGKFPVGGAMDKGGPPGGILYRMNNGQITNYAVYGPDGMILRRVDLVGEAHVGVDGQKVPTPHVQEWSYNETPDGRKYPKQSKYAIPAGPGDLPSGAC
ncbi:polymorphic toxin-type HINT domain-containing protein [Micromonospora sp. WMMD1155]|uniref:polymorphic toxin-type HINT domain-containing protein n=1 Tax=Micromonospora sp. WMMD1155 TaxID=3016094 RepID=UPI00249AD7FF|nr:polymorphic toxin-type HINT domain-containing protein [Micromonospora sp. WMMD1155]WFE50002.1 polymorphic toxin-type HINT domain-containing protein [Micromonospora sp. WMMD1155]